MYSLYSILDNLKNPRIELIYSGELNKLMAHIPIPDITVGFDAYLGLFDMNCVDPEYQTPFGIILSHQKDGETKYLRMTVCNYAGVKLEEYSELVNII